MKYRVNIAAPSVAAKTGSDVNKKSPANGRASQFITETKYFWSRFELSPVPGPVFRRFEPL